MPINYKDYPKNWFTEIRPRILARANNCCEFCGVRNKLKGFRTKQGVFLDWQHIEDRLKNENYDYFQHELSHCYSDVTGGYKKETTIVLTIAHLDHDKENH